MNRLIKYFLLLSQFALAVQITTPEIIEEKYYTEDNYIRSALFLEQDNIYNRNVTFQPGLELICLQDKVKVEINSLGTFYTPLDKSNIPPGEYQVRLSKSGYHPMELRVGISPGKRTSIIVNLKENKGKLQFEGLPDNAVVFINNLEADPLNAEINAGFNSIMISAFGYEQYKDIIEYSGQGIFRYKPEMVEKDFNLSRIAVNRRELWLNDSDSQKKAKISIIADAPGTGSISIYRKSDKALLEYTQIQFEKRITDYVFDLNNYNNPPEGQYIVEVKGGDDTKTSVLETSIEIHPGYKSLMRNNFSGFSGFLFSPTTEILPRGVFQIQTIISPVYRTESLNELYTPAIFSVRTAFFDNIEISAGASLFISHLQDRTSLDIFASGKYEFLRIKGSQGISMAVGLSLNYMGKISAFGEIPGFDPFGGVTGLSIILPVSYRIGILSFHLTPEFKISPSYPGEESSGFAGDSIHLWNYFKGAVALDTGNYTVAISAALQSPSYINRDNTWPLFIGLEGVMTPGISGFSFSLFGGVRYVSNETKQIISGFSAGFIF